MRAKIAVILILSLAGGTMVYGAEEDGKTGREKRFGFIREGFVLDGVEGTVTRA